MSDDDEPLPEITNHILSKDELVVLGEIALHTATTEHFTHLAVWHLLDVAVPA